jgi:hypothetical protein
MKFQLLLKEHNTQIVINKTRVFTDRAQMYACAERFTQDNNFIYANDENIFSHSADNFFELHMITF